jgi:hypothetical protein
MSDVSVLDVWPYHALQELQVCSIAIPVRAQNPERVFRERGMRRGEEEEEWDGDLSDQSSICSLIIGKAPLTPPHIPPNLAIETKAQEGDRDKEHATREKQREEREDKRETRDRDKRHKKIERREGK